MASITICDLCKDRKALEAGSFKVTVAKFSERSEEKEEFEQWEWDVCPDCMGKLHAAGLELD